MVDHRRMYRHYIYKWHLVIPRVLILSPLLAVKALVGLSIDLLESFQKGMDELYERVNGRLPVPYTIEMVPFEGLSHREKETERELERLHHARVGRMLSQIQTSPTAKNDN